jgi:hypothetical protein
MGRVKERREAHEAEVADLRRKLRAANAEIKRLKAEAASAAPSE